MKNISRRVFIKGLAVAGVAAAASTVLAGCNTNMIPGVDDDQDNEVTEPDASNKYTFTKVDGETLVISAPSAVTTAVDASAAGNVKIAIPVEVQNNLGANVVFSTTNALTTVPEGYCVVLSAKVYDDKGADMTASLAASAAQASAFSFANLLGAASTTGVTVAKGVSNTYAIGFKEGKLKDWAKIVITAKVYEAISDGETAPSYHYDSVEDDKYEFTYTR